MQNRLRRSEREQVLNGRSVLVRFKLGIDSHSVLDTMSQFHHSHIIQLMGVSCASTIVWIILELAPLGELRQYLKREQPSIDLSIQLLFSKQLADAVAYLTKHTHVHRDIAARNVLVSTPKCIKLSDFGMCRLLDEEVYNCKF